MTADSSVGSVSAQLIGLSPSTRLLIQPQYGPQFECSIYLHDRQSDYLVTYGSRVGEILSDLRLLKVSNLKKVTPLSERTQSGRSTPKKAGATTPARRGSRPETPNSPRDDMTEDGKLLLAGLGKHLSVKANGKVILVSLSSSEARIEPPYTKVDGDGEEMARVRRILESERSVLPKRGKKKDVKIPAMGG